MKVVDWKLYWAAFSVVVLSSSPVVLQASSVCTPGLFSSVGDDLPEELPIENGSAASVVAQFLGCDMPSFVSQKVPVRSKEGKEVGVLVGVVAEIDGKSRDDGYWLVKESEGDSSYAVPSMAAALDDEMPDKPALQLGKFSTSTSQMPAMVDNPSGGFLTRNGYSSSAQVVAVNAGFWPSERYAVTFLSEPNGGIVHRGKVAKKPTEWAVVIKSSSLPTYSIVSLTDEVCSYEGAEVKINENSKSVTFFCAFSK